MHEKIVANTSHCNEKRQCFGTPFVWDQPQYQYCSRLHDTAPRIIQGLYHAVQYCSYLRGSRLPYISISLIDHYEDSMVKWLRRRTAILTTGWWDGSNPDRGYICKFFSLNWKYFMSNRSFFASGKIYKQLILRYFIGLFPFHWHSHLSRVASKSGYYWAFRHSAYTL